MATAPELVTLSNGEVLAIGVYNAMLKLQVAARNAGFGGQVWVSSGYRTRAKQVSIFVNRYRQVSSSAIRGPFNDVRFWNGSAYGYPGTTRWVRYSPEGTVAVPGTSMHEKASAVDFGGINAKGTSAFARWMRANAATYGFSPTGYSFGEAWHYDYTGNPWAGGGNIVIPPTTPKEIKVKTYHYEDKTARTKGKTLAAGATTYLHTTLDAPSYNAVNVVGGVGPYSLTAHIYAEGKPGDAVDLCYLWDDTKTAGPHSPNYTKRFVIGPDGKLFSGFETKKSVSPGFAVYLRASTPAANKSAVKITILDSDAMLFTVG